LLHLAVVEQFRALTSSTALRRAAPSTRHGSANGLCQRCIVPLCTTTSPAPISVFEPSSSSSQRPEITYTMSVVAERNWAAAGM
jgi:hypothetical protein